jgi:uncharacterized protein YgiM (DUF1202 family)
MKTFLPLGAVLLLLISACKQFTSESASSVDSAASAVASPSLVSTFCVWNELGVHETPGEKAKYITSIYLGEKLTLVGDTASEKSGSKRIHYNKVQLSDGKQGWVRNDFIAIDAIPAAFLQETNLCKRPDLATVTDKNFTNMDFVAARPGSDGWVEVTGRRSGDKWFTSGYVKAEALTYTPIEVEFAVLNRRAAETDNQKLKETLYGQLSNASVFGASEFYSAMYATEEESDGEPEPGGDMDMSTEEEVSDASPGENMLFQASNYPTRFVAQQNLLGEMLEVDGIVDSLEVTYRLVTGLNPQCSECVTLESVKYPGYYFSATGALTAEGYRLQIYLLSSAPNADQRQQFLNAMSFRKVDGLASASQGISFASQYFPGFYIRHKDFHMWMRQNDGGETFKQDATFVQVPR